MDHSVYLSCTFIHLFLSYCFCLLLLKELVYLQMGKITVKKMQLCFSSLFRTLLRYSSFCHFTSDSECSPVDSGPEDVSVRLTFEALALFVGVYVIALYKSTFIILILLSTGTR